MTYDFHGVWDKPNQWVGPYLNSHTNLTEIKLGLDLLWRNGIKPDQVTLGLAFYGRGFAATSSSCLKPGCTFESGTPPQICSNEISVLLNSEIDELVTKKNLKPTLDKDAAVKIITYDQNNWVTYDDADTLQIKADFARSQCLGGVMVWAVSHDTKDAKYSKALAKAAPRNQNPYISMPMNDGSDDDSEVDTEYHSQCRWTNCNENCPNDWVRMMRNDPDGGYNEYMVDGGTCNESGGTR